ncbi:TA system VapC family ribonuclease toxin [Skermania sp. ID1734]|uniref:TA system VapC family ribonuclease toxin n=1 Tax=Skermania sp. ID1734 TaxID=2597516 RepID=UPI001C8F1F3B|nr:TA system VapC family ribonuclease toxin [Skermania sp. ID1734]
MNVLIYAFREGAPEHDQYADWLNELVGGADELALHDAVLGGFVRIVTNPRIADPPAKTATALKFVKDLRQAKRVSWLHSSDAVWDQLAKFAHHDRGIRANAIPDAYLAACAKVHGAQLATADRGFGRFPGFRWFDPADRPFS